MNLADMSSTLRVSISFLSVLLAHLLGLGIIVLAPAQAGPRNLEQPGIQGILVSSQPASTPLPPSPPTVRKPQAARATPKVSPSEPVATHELAPSGNPSPPDLLAPTEKSPEAVIAPPRTEANGLGNPAPVYPAQSRKLAEEGTVLLEVLVRADGSLGDMRLKKSSGYARLDDAAQRALKKWHFLPAIRAGEPIDFWYEIPIEFSLNR